jgi:hypothetical protein
MFSVKKSQEIKIVSNSMSANLKVGKFWSQQNKSTIIDDLLYKSK